MKQWAVVPMNPLDVAKSRLASILDMTEKQNLVVALFTHTILQLQECGKFEGIAVITADPFLWEISNKMNIIVIQETKPKDLNSSLQSALVDLKERQVNNLLILPGDLPYLNSRVLVDMISEMEQSNQMMITPDQYLNGTNALFINPLDKLPFSFGPNSFAKHIQLAKQLKYRIKIYISDHLKIDIDTPKDYKQHQNILQALLAENRFPIPVQKDKNA
jgi:2-phospho-L-lactate guanylyltransferase